VLEHVRAEQVAVRENANRRRERKDEHEPRDREEERSLSEVRTSMDRVGNQPQDRDANHERVFVPCEQKVVIGHARFRR
jgi:hypothetical protein